MLKEQRDFHSTADRLPDEAPSIETLLDGKSIWAEKNLAQI